MKPVLFVTGHAPAYRVASFAHLHERENVEYALFGGRLAHGGGATADELPFPHRHVPEHTHHGAQVQGAASHVGTHPKARRQARELFELAASGHYRAVVISTGGRVALPGAWAGARRARVPLILWTSLWAHPRSVAHALSYPALLRLYRSADAVVTYGPHVSAYVRARGARHVHEASQAVDNAFWSSPDAGIPTELGRSSADMQWPSADAKFLFAGRPGREKGLGVLEEAWSMSGLQAPTAALVLVGAGSTPPWVPAGGAVARPASPHGTVGNEPVGLHRARACVGGAVGSKPAEPDRARARVGGTVAHFAPVSQLELRNFYEASDVLVVPSIPTRTFREPWGLVANEAMNRGLPVIASDAVGAAAGGLVQDGRNGLVVPAGDAVALAAALRRLARDPALRARLGAAAREDVAGYTHEAWAEGFSRALADVGQSGGR